MDNSKAVWSEHGDPGNCPNCGADGIFGAEFEQWIYPMNRPFQETVVKQWWEKPTNWRCWSCDRGTVDEPE